MTYKNALGKYNIGFTLTKEQLARLDTLVIKLGEQTQTPCDRSKTIRYLIDNARFDESAKELV